MPEASAGVLDERPAALAPESLGPLLVVEGPDRLRRLREGGIVRVDLDVSEDDGGLALEDGA
jgi:hypothetical protein